jgi:uncharacterized protein (UPF0335 family)
MEVIVDLKTIINKLQAAFDRIQKLEEENKKLKAIVNCLAHADANAVGATQIYINNARQVLKDIGEE